VTGECESGFGKQNIMSAVFSFIYPSLSKPTFKLRGPVNKNIDNFIWKAQELQVWG
jgi:hypothetical protein